MPERKLEESLSALARMYAFNVGDLPKARDYYQQALASIEASAAVRQKALTEDRFYTPEQKAAMTKEELAKHEETEAQTRDMKLALDRMSQAMALLNLGDISQEEGDLRKAVSYYEIARKVGEDLPKGGYINEESLASSCGLSSACKLMQNTKQEIRRMKASFQVILRHESRNPNSTSSSISV